MNTSDLPTDEKVTIPATNSWHPLQTAGLALLSSSLVFAVLLFALQIDAFLGVIIGCAVTGLVLSTVGLVLTKRTGHRDNGH